jgi:hypothetical protein
VTYLFILSALLCLLFPTEMMTTDLGRFWLFAMAGFWLARALIQPIFFRLGHPLSLALFAVFLLGAIIHGIAWASARGVVAPSPS